MTKVKEAPRLHTCSLASWKCLEQILLNPFNPPGEPFQRKREQQKLHVERGDILPCCCTIVIMRKTLVGVTCFIFCLVVIRPTSYNDILATTRPSRTPV